jgi:hypothetical protein
MRMLLHLSLPCSIDDRLFFGDDLLLEVDLQPAILPRHWSFVTIVFKSTLKWPG